MKRMKVSGLVMVAAICIFLPQWGIGDEPAPRKEVLAKDLHECTIIGLLGQPYGDVVHIQGYWEEPSGLAAHNAYPDLRITHIDLERLPPGKEIVISGKHIHTVPQGKKWRPGERYLGSAYESGGMDTNGVKFCSFLHLLDGPSSRPSREHVPVTRELIENARRG